MPRLIFGARLTGEITSQADTVTDFRLDRLRRRLKSGQTPDAIVIAEKYASGGLAEAQYLLGEMLSTRGQAGDAEAALTNKTRNELKHLSSGARLTISLEEECIRMLDRAVENYRLLHKRAAIFVVQYERRRAVLRGTPRGPRYFPRGLKARRSGR
jgi:hypothetical protein